MLELNNFCFSIDKDGEPVNLVDRVNLSVPAGHFMAIVGPSGCGKTTLLNTIAGLNIISEGDIFWDGRNLETEGDLEPAEIGYVPQFSIAYDELTVDESIEAVTKLRVKSQNAEQCDARIDRVLEETGLSSIADRPVKVLSGGQKRRLGLAMELVTDPHLLLCDEVTSGLDPRSERDIVRNLHQLSRSDGRIVISVTHSLAHLELYDSILVLHEGKIAYHGPPSEMVHYFSVSDTEEIYPRLAKQDAEKWHTSWQKHRNNYYRRIETNRQKLIAAGELELPPHITKTSDAPSHSESAKDSYKATIIHPDDDPKEMVRTPNFLSQFFTLLTRRWTIFFRDRGQVFLQLSILIIFPILVIIFSAQGNEPLLNYPNLNDYSMQSIQDMREIGENRARVGGAISGIIMFQVVLLTLMGSNNAAREIASERQILEKEKFGGVSPLAYLLSKIAFLAVIVLIQSLVMGIAVNQAWEFKGTTMSDTYNHFTFLILVNAAMTSICLGISSLMRTSEQASLLSIYLVGFQLPLSGAVLALPSLVGEITRPFISAYWAWSGSINSLQTNYAAAIKNITDTPLEQTSHSICLGVLGLHIIVGIIMTYIGIRRHQWQS